MSARWPRRAVIDIGSNSVRLVIFSGPPRVPFAIFNEKVLCGLGDREPETGDLRADSMASALLALRRFNAVVESEEPEMLDVFATAAVRDAPNGASFTEKIRALGFEPRIISGEEEARLAGLGILCSAPEIKREGLVSIGGDLGGGSLELSLLGQSGQDIAETVSLPIGSLRLLSQYGEDRTAAEAEVSRLFDGLAWIETLAAPNLYIVGGSWRAIARVGMHVSEHPLSILDHYAMAGDQAQDVCRFVEAADPEDLGNISGVQKKRVPTLPMASIVLRQLITRSGAGQVVVSACGVREGLLFDALPARVRAEEPLLALSKDLARRRSGGRLPNHRSVVSFCDALFDETAARRRLRQAAAIMLRIGNNVHPDRRAEHAAATIMSAPFVGIDHVERAMLAVMIKTRVGGGAGKSDGIIPYEVMTDEELAYAVRVGRAHRLTATLRQPMFGDGNDFTLSVEDDTLLLSVDAGGEQFLGEAVDKDFSRLAAEFGLQPAIRQSSDS